MHPVNLKKSLYIKQKVLMFGLGGYKHNHRPSIWPGNSVTSPRDENCPRWGLVQNYHPSGTSPRYLVRKIDRAVISSNDGRVSRVVCNATTGAEIDNSPF
jgi:hypothetical protein